MKIPINSMSIRSYRGEKTISIFAKCGELFPKYFLCDGLKWIKLNSKTGAKPKTALEFYFFEQALNFLCLRMVCPGLLPMFLNIPKNTFEKCKKLGTQNKQVERNTGEAEKYLNNFIVCKEDLVDGICGRKK